jgi:hypothetical protein
MRERLESVLVGKLNRSASTVRRDVTAQDLVLALSMLAALLSRTDKQARPDTAERAWALLRKGLQK